MNNEYTDIVEFLELMEFTLSDKFTEKWCLKYSKKFIKHFQSRVMLNLIKKKTLKLNTLYLYLNKKCKYNSVQILNFFESIDIDIYRPFIEGKIHSVL